MSVFPGGMGEPRMGATDEDKKLAVRVQNALSENMSLQAHPIQVIACEGDVELRGTVPDSELRQLAASLARSAPGVRNVINHIAVTGGRA